MEEKLPEKVQGNTASIFKKIKFIFRIEKLSVMC